MDLSILYTLPIFLIFGLITAWVAARKGRSIVEGLLLGALLAPIGLLIEIALPRLEPIGSLDAIPPGEPELGFDRSKLKETK
jgi:hypothetical protein